MKERTIEKLIWKHASPTGKPDYRGQDRFAVRDEEGDIIDHYATLEDAKKAIDNEAWLK